MCQVILDAKKAGALKTVQEIRYGVFAEMLIRSFAKIGIISLVDEATGYQEVRDRLALQKILALFIGAELAKWVKRFPDEFYAELFRLRGWQWQGVRNQKPSVVGHYTNDLVYARLVPGVLDELRRLNPPDEAGHRKHKHHQWLTADVGHPKLRDLLSGVIALMKASPSWSNFMHMMDKVYPRRGDSQMLPMDLPEQESIYNA